MADIQSELDLTFVEVGTQFRAVRSLVGALANLSTSAKSSLVDALNEVNAKTNSAGAVIDDANVSSSKTYSSSKIVSTVNDRAAALKTEILGGAGPTVDTLKEIADIIAQSDLDDDAALAALTTAVGYRLRFDEAQTLTAAQKVQGNANLGSVSLAQFGNPEHSYRAVLLAAINS